MTLADPLDDHDDLPIELLIGGDFYWHLVRAEQPVRISASLALIPSTLGWIMSGNRTSVTVNSVSVNHICLATDNPSDATIRSLWDLETIGIRESQDTTHSERNLHILDDVHASFRLDEGRRVVSLPWKPDIALPNDNRRTAVCSETITSARCTTPT